MLFSSSKERSLEERSLEEEKIKPNMKNFINKHRAEVRIFIIVVVVVILSQIISKLMK